MKTLGLKFMISFIKCVSLYFWIFHAPLFSYTKEHLDKLEECQHVQFVTWLSCSHTLSMGNKGFLCVLTHGKTENCQGKEHHNIWGKLNTVKTDVWKIAINDFYVCTFFVINIWIRSVWHLRHLFLFFTSHNFYLKLWDTRVNYTCTIHKFNCWIFLVLFLSKWTDCKLKLKEVSYHIENKDIRSDFIH